MSDGYQAEIAFPAMECSLSFVASRNATAASRGSFADSRSTVVHTFQYIEELRYALAEFHECYNRRWIVQRRAASHPPGIAGSSLGAELHDYTLRGLEARMVCA